MFVDTDVLIIGAGLSGLGFAVQLQEKYPKATFEIIEKAEDVGGTWLLNTYPGCACDVPSHLYSYSFALNPDWSEQFAPQREIFAYCRSVADKYDIPRHISFRSTVRTAKFDELSGTWVVEILDQQSGQVYEKRSRILISAVGLLSEPNECEFPGVEKYEGKLFHSARWDHSFDWAGKNVVVVGNGCSATQFVPALTQGPGKAAKLVQFTRQPHWLFERPNVVFSPLFKWVMRYVPFAMRLFRFFLFCVVESTFFMFDKISGKKIREKQRRSQTEYIKKQAPAKYHDALIPKAEVGCKRRVLDTGYLASLHRDNIELVHSDPIERVTPTGVRTTSGREVHADAIILATGFKAQQPLFPMEIKGEDGISLTEYWNNCSSRSPQAYRGTCVSGFPNFFMFVGPNTATGHMSVIYTSECQINFTLKVVGPILRSLYSPPSLLSALNPFSPPAPDTVSVTREAEDEENRWIQTASEKLVWLSGCASWYLHPNTGRNTILYPDWPFRYWLRGVFVSLSRDFVFKPSSNRLQTWSGDTNQNGSSKAKEGKSNFGRVVTISSTLGVIGLAIGLKTISLSEGSV